MNPQEVLLIGGMGYVGRKLQRPLLKAGYRVHVLDKTAPVQRGNEEIEFHEGLLSDESILKEVMGRCGTVFYLASDSVPTTTVKYPALEGELNVLPFLKFLDYFRLYHGVHLVYISSGGTIYGNPRQFRLKIQVRLRPFPTTGRKAAIEAFLRVYSSQLITE
jgi:UDP-glucose 4-epimerase